MPTPDTDQLTCLCPAKVNFALSVGPPQADKLHPIASWMVALNFGDRLSLQRAPGHASTWQIAFADDAPAPQPIDWPLESDLAYRAHQLLQSHVGQALPVNARLAKYIPAGAGLGGGSSDAAATLVALNQLFELQQSPRQLMQLARQLGSDVVFLVAALQGSPSAMVTGTGEAIEPIPRTRPIHLVLVLPPFTCPTGPVYGMFDRQHASDAALREAAVRALAHQDTLSPEAPFNDLAGAAREVQPRLAEAVTQLQQTLAMPVHITGSGAAMFVIAHSPEHARTLAETITGATRLAAVPTHTKQTCPLPPTTA